MSEPPIPPIIPQSAPRYLPDEPLPPYSYVTGRYPHPTRDGGGHSFGQIPAICSTPDSERWRDSREYLRGVDLFNHGYYWEAHEAWEGLWHACGRSGPAANFFKGLIKLAAAGVKLREGRLEGVRTHALRAAELFQIVASELVPASEHYFGLSLSRLRAWALDLGHGRAVLNRLTGAPVEIAWPWILQPDETM